MVAEVVIATDVQVISSLTLILMKDGQVEGVPLRTPAPIPLPTRLRVVGPCCVVKVEGG